MLADYSTMSWLVFCLLQQQQQVRLDCLWDWLDFFFLSFVSAHHSRYRNKYFSIFVLLCCCGCCWFSFAWYESPSIQSQFCSCCCCCWWWWWWCWLNRLILPEQHANVQWKVIFGKFLSSFIQQQQHSFNSIDELDMIK